MRNQQRSSEKTPDRVRLLLLSGDMAGRAGNPAVAGGGASDGNRRNCRGCGYSSTMTQEADRSPAQAEAGAARASALPPAATPGTGQLGPDAGRSAGPTASPAHGSGRRSGSRGSRKPQGRPSLGG